MKFRIAIIMLFIALMPLKMFAAIHFSTGKGWSWNQLVLKATAKEQLEYCQSLEKAKQYGDAISHYKLLIKVFDKSTEAAEAYNRIGELYMLQGKWNLAQKYYENLLNLQIEETSKVIHTLNKKKKKGSKINDQEKQLMFSILLRGLQKSGSKDNNNNPLLNIDNSRIFANLFQIGNAYLKGTRYQLFGVIPLWKQKSKFLSVYSYILLRAPNFDKCPQMQKAIAIYKMDKKDYFEAIDEFKKLSYEYSLSPEAQDVKYYLGVCRKKSSKGPAYNQENIDFAEANIKDYLSSQPDGNMVTQAKDVQTQIMEERSENYLIKIKFFIRRHQWEAAKIYINELASKFPDSASTKKAKKLALRHTEISL